MFPDEISSLVLICCASFYSLISGSIHNTTHTIQCLIDLLNQCPPNSSCDQGSCVCLRHFKQNPDFNEHKKNEFCIEISTAQSSNGNKSITYDKVFREAPTHHILGGILIPICAVIMILATIILVNKMQPVQRIRQLLLSNRPRRPAYEDVVLVGYEQ